MTSFEWLNGQNKPLKRVSLEPLNMEKLSANFEKIIKTETKYNSKIELLKAKQSEEKSHVYFCLFILLNYRLLINLKIRLVILTRMLF